MPTIDVPDGYVPIILPDAQARKLITLVASSFEIPGFEDLVASDPDPVAPPFDAADMAGTMNPFNCNAWIAFIMRKLDEVTP